VIAVEFVFFLSLSSIRLHCKPIGRSKGYGIFYFFWGLNFFLEILFFWQVIYDKTTGRSRGFGFVTMSTVEEVEAAA